MSICRPRTNLQRFRVRVDNLTFIGRKPPAKTSNPFTTPQPTLETDEVLERIGTIQSENLKRLDDDIDNLTAYLKAEGALKATISSTSASSST